MNGRQFWEQVGDAVVGLVPAELGPCSTRHTSANVKVWFGDEGREHYEAQFLRDGGVEVGFHAEHRSPERNDAVLGALLDAGDRWRPDLGDAVEGGEFLGVPGGPWRRLSEVRPAPSRLDVDSALEIAEHLATYAELLEPLRTGRPARRRAN